MSPQPVGTIAPVRPRPSILTSARDRTSDGFGTANGATVELLDLVEDDAERARIREQLTSWRTGVSWLPASCQRSLAWPRCPDTDAEKDRASDRTAAAVEAFTIYTPLECDWVSSERGEELAQDARDLTETHTAYAVARALWLGEGLPDEVTPADTAIAHPTLRRAAVDLSIAGGAATLEDVVAVLLAAYEDCTGGNGGAVLHVPAQLIPYATGGGAGGATLARLEGDLYRGPLGSVVSPGPGYPAGASIEGADGFGPLIPGSDPEEYEGNAADEAWVYVTGPVEYALGPVRDIAGDEAELREGLHRLNRFEAIGERSALVRFDPCCVFAALAQAPDTTGVAS